MSDNTDESTPGTYSGQSSNRSIDLNVNNIESINVLQGPAAAALLATIHASGTNIYSLETSLQKLLP